MDLLHDSVEKIREAASSTGASIAGPVPLPTRCAALGRAPREAGAPHSSQEPQVASSQGRQAAGACSRRGARQSQHPPPRPARAPRPCRKKVYTVLRSPHVNKDSREQFEVRLHQRLVDVKDLSSGTIDRLMTLDLPAGVDIEVRGGGGAGAWGQPRRAGWARLGRAGTAGQGAGLGWAGCACMDGERAPSCACARGRACQAPAAPLPCRSSSERAAPAHRTRHARQHRVLQQPPVSGSGRSAAPQPRRSSGASHGSPLPLPLQQFSPRGPPLCARMLPLPFPL